MADNFEVGIGGNVDGLKKAFNDGINASQKFEKSAIGSAAGIENAFSKINFSKSISTLEGQLRNFQSGVKASTNPESILRLNRAIDQTKIRLDALNKFASSGGLNKFAGQANSAGFALTNLGRVAQDAPFGFIGIQNNLNPLLESFGRLKQETGSVGGAFKALGSSLMGPAGLGIALSVVSAAVLFYQQYQQKANKTVNEAKKGSEDYIKTLDQVTQAQLKGAQNAVSELTTLKLLYAQTQNVTLSQKQRVAASDELQNKYPAYFKNLSDETILAGGAASKYKELAQAILATARARAAEDLISTNTKRQLENEQKIIDLKKSELKLQKDLAKVKALESATNQGTSSLTSGAGSVTAAQKVFGVQSKIGENIKLQNNLKTDSNILDARNLELIKSINTEIEKGAKLSGGVGDLPTGSTNKLDRVAKVDYAEGVGLGTLEKRISKNMEKLNTSGNVTAFEIPVAFSPATMASAGEVFKEYFDYDLLPQLGTSFDNFFNDILEKGEFSFKSLSQSIKKTFASVLASEATSGLLKVLGAKGKSMDGKGGLFPALAGLLGKGGGAAGTATAGAGAAGAGGILAGFSPAALAVGGAVIAGSLISSIVKGINKNKQLPNLYGPGGSSFIGESRTRGNDLLHTWYRTQKRKGR